jgi:hypothetical protein
VIGGSEVAVEYSSFFRAVGRRTTIVSRGALLTTQAPAGWTPICGGSSWTGCQRDVELLEHSVVTRILGAGRADWVPPACGPTSTVSTRLAT